jgi:hypothetical protein
VSGGDATLRKAETPLVEFVRVIDRPLPDQIATVREARIQAAAARHTPTAIMVVPHKLRSPSANPIGSFALRGSSRMNDGTAKASVAPAATVKGSSRSRKSKSAQRFADCRRAKIHTAGHTAQTAVDNPA